MVRTEKGNFSENSDSGVVDDAATCLFLWWELVLTPEEEEEKRLQQIQADSGGEKQNAAEWEIYLQEVLPE